MQMMADRNEVECSAPFDPPAGHTHSMALVQHEKELRAPDDVSFYSEKESEEKEA